MDKKNTLLKACLVLALVGTGAALLAACGGSSGGSACALRQHRRTVRAALSADHIGPAAGRGCRRRAPVLAVFWRAAV